MRTLQSFFESTVPRILHPTVKSWTFELYVSLLVPTLSSLVLNPSPTRMEQRRASWTARGWAADYVHISPAGLIPAVNGNGTGEDVDQKVMGSEKETERTKRIPERVWGEHREEEAERES